MSVAAGKGVEEAGRIGPVPQRQCGQLESCPPAFGPRFQQRRVRRCELQPHGVAAEASRLLRVTPQIGLEQLAASTQSGQRQSRIGARPEHQVEPRRQVLNQERQPGVDGGVFGKLIVVQDEHNIPVELAQLDDELGGYSRGQQQT